VGDIFRLIADRKIQEAMDEGAFERLSGAGQPLDLEENPFEDPSLGMAHRLLRNNGFAPCWIEAGKEIDLALAELWHGRAVGRVGAEEFRRRAEDLNRRILSFNLQAPAAAAHKLPIDIERELGPGPR
jgi:DnaJ family protein C protein 28